MKGYSGRLTQHGLQQGYCISVWNESLSHGSASYIWQAAVPKPRTPNVELYQSLYTQDLHTIRLPSLRGYQGGGCWRMLAHGRGILKGLADIPKCQHCLYQNHELSFTHTWTNPTASPEPNGFYRVALIRKSLYWNCIVHS